MNNLKESKREPSPNSRLHYSVGDNTIELREYLNRRQPEAPASDEANWQGLEDLDPVPSMFRVKKKRPRPRPGRAKIARGSRQKLTLHRSDSFFRSGQRRRHSRLNR